MSPSALDVLASLHRHTSAAGIAPPAALIGSWLDADAVIAPSLEVVDGCAPPDRPDRFWLGQMSFPVGAGSFPTVAGGLTDAVLLLRDGKWTYLDVTGSPCPDWVTDALARPRADDARQSGADKARQSSADKAGRSSADEARWSSADETRWSTADEARWSSADEALAESVYRDPAPVSARWQTPTPIRRADHRRAVLDALDAIAAGEIYQVCVCTRLDGKLDGDPLAFFSTVAAATAPAKAAFLQGDWGTIASFSPESFLRRRGEEVTSSPIKGTLPAHGDPRDLAMSTKDVAENVMIVDLVRNDLGRVATVGSVTVPELLTVVGAPGVWHLVSTVRAELDDTVGNDALLAATFPPASVTGTPKIRAAELIGQWESLPRGVYCGAIGVAGPDHALDLSVAIRTVEIDPDGTMRLGVGGGITMDSDPDREWQECLDKAAAILSALR
ncbi:aminodeoxychorismate synthase component I [Gordonia sp. X0973]|uniref:aminodeoxychorismate synthase component I n=1 Tax=Gordonia sp. X0973 TaxID=2742602 RepID=UPI000F52AD80|nr:aminodeoxychorismate synthase component I [Gordonia sp. X0973]QKT06478.1 aminodeoxychorismate synthase component I [Gordonia sp. X0973]